jgi:hypothetical protein
MRISVIKQYSDRFSGLDLETSTELILGHVPPQMLHGISTILLRETSNLSRKELDRLGRTRARRPSGKSLLGAYFPATRAQAAHIELFVDQILDGWPKILLQIPILRNFLLSEVIFHEVGHHAEFKKNNFREKERLAIQWSKRLRRRFIRQRYGYLRPFRWVLMSFIAILKIFSSDKRRR